MEKQNQSPQPYQPFDYNELVPIPDPQPPLEEHHHSEHIIFIDKPHLTVFCPNCRKVINKSISILSNGIYRCIPCFAKQPVSTEPYILIKNLSFPVIDYGWKAIHQILFLDNLETSGFDNWKEIKDRMDDYGVKYKEQQIQNHYLNCYFTAQDELPKFLNNDSFFLAGKPPQVNPTSIVSLSTAHQNEQYEEIDVFYHNTTDFRSKQTTFLEGYNKNRNQFQVEYDQDAEFLLANLEFRDDDTEEEKKIKFEMIDEYNRRLERRNQVKKFILEHRLLEENYQKQMDRNRTDLQKQAFEELKPIARFTSLNEYNALVRKVAFSKQLKLTIQGLRKFRRTHPSNFKNLDQFLNSQPEQSRPRKRIHHNENSIKTGKKMDQVLQRHFKLTKRDFETLMSNLLSNGKKTVYKNVQAVLLENNQ